MRFLAYTLGDDKTPIPPPTPQMMQEMGKFMDEAVKAGVLVETGGMAPTSQGTTVRFTNNRYSVTDGPYAESKELIGGWALLEVKSKDEAIDWTKRFLKIAGGGESRLRQVFGPNDPMPGFNA